MSEATICFRDEKLNFEGYLVVDRVIDGFCGGGLRMAPDVSLEFLKGMSALMSLKFGIMGIRCGGAKSGIKYDPRSPDRDKIIARMGELMKPYLTDCYIIGEDVGTGRADLITIYRTIKFDIMGHIHRRAVQYGRSLQIPDVIPLGGLMKEEFIGTAAGHGVGASVVTACEAASIRIADLPVSIQGFGSVGRAAASYCAACGMRVICVADRAGTMTHEDGLDVAFLKSVTDSFGTVDRARLPSSVRCNPDPESWLKVPAVTLIPAAVENMINAANASSISGTVKLIVEGANSPIDDATEVALEKSGVTVVPDFVANAGSAVAYGLLFTGLASKETVETIYMDRIRGATDRVLKDKSLGSFARARATTLAKQAFA